MKTLPDISNFTAAQIRKLCTGKPTPTAGYHPSHRCRDIYLITPTGGAVCFHAHNPQELINRKAWHKEAMTDWLADQAKRNALVRIIREDLCESRDEAIRQSLSVRPTKFIENGNLFFVCKGYRNETIISQL